MKEIMNASKARAKSREVKERNTETAIQELIKDVEISINLGQFNMNKLFSYPINVNPIKEYFVKNGYGVEVGYLDSNEIRITVTWY